MKSVICRVISSHALHQHYINATKFRRIKCCENICLISSLYCPLFMFPFLAFHISPLVYRICFFTSTEKISSRLLSPQRVGSIIDRKHFPGIPQLVPLGVWLRFGSFCLHTSGTVAVWLQKKTPPDAIRYFGMSRLVKTEVVKRNYFTVKFGWQLPSLIHFPRWHGERTS